jgi:hypothetical protein
MKTNLEETSLYAYEFIYEELAKRVKFPLRYFLLDAEK